MTDAEQPTGHDATTGHGAEEHAAADHGADEHWADEHGADEHGHSAGVPEVVRILVYSDDRTFREQIRLALGRKVAADLPEVRLVECATAPAAIRAVELSRIDLGVLDAETAPLGGMGLARQLKSEIADCPPMLLLVARIQDAWLATWSRVEAVMPQPADPLELPRVAAELLRARLQQPV